MSATLPAIKVKKVADKIYCILFKSYREMGRTMLRFEEHYECTSAYFRKNPFTLKEYKAWYKTALHGGTTGKFTYYTDWGGYNLHAENLLPFYDGTFKYITKREKQLLYAFRDMEPYDFYIIGLVGDSRDWTEELSHELSHAMFRVNETYRKRTTKIIKKCMHKLSTLNKYLRSEGYCRGVMIDEATAYLACDSEWLATKGVKIDHLTKEITKLKHLFLLHKPKNTFDISSWKRR